MFSHRRTNRGRIKILDVGDSGPYIQVGKLFVSITPEDLTALLERHANTAAKLETKAAKRYHKFPDGVKVLERSVVYINSTKNVKILKIRISYYSEKALELLNIQPAKASSQTHS